MSAEQDLEGEPPASPLAERPAPDQLARAVAKAKIAGALFATKQQVKLGRYHLLEQVGRGGMGVVWGAWDPELERRVAVKVLEATGGNARERILREGQALAKLSHPIVVPVFDVGVVDERVYLVMEWVRGENERTWAAAPREVREIVRVFRDAGAGLEAAHAAGLIHRDFKPENAVVGEDGRVRVLDFGLARSHVAGEDAGVAGTPRYMAPEQAAGGELSPAVDQFAFGVAMRELVRGRRADGRERDEPAWIAAITTRAMQPSPDARFPSMAALLHALARDPRTVWGRRLAVVGALGVAGAAFAAGTMRASDGVEPCRGADAEIASVWSQPARAAVVAHVRTLGPYGAAVADDLERDLGDYASRWARAHRSACVASEAGELPPRLYEQQLRCLGRARASLATAVDVLVHTTMERLPDAVRASSTLPDVDGCRDEGELVTVLPPPAMLAPRVAEIANDVARARVLALAADPSAIAASETAARLATELGYTPLVGRAALAHGVALLLQNHPERAIAALDEATTAAFSSGDTVTAIEALARELYAIAISTSASDELPSSARDATASVKLAESIARGLGPSGAFARALLFNNIGTLALSRQQRSRAQTYFTEAMRARPRVAGPTLELATLAGNLGMVQNETSSRDRLLAQEVREVASIVGSDHPMALDAALKAAMFVDDARVARSQLTDACDRYHRMHPHLVEKVSQCAYEVAWLAHAAGDRDAMLRALGQIATRDVERRLADGLRELEARPGEILTEMRALATELQARGNTWARWRSVDALTFAALAARAAAQPALSHTLARQAQTTMDELPGLAATTFYRRRRERLVPLAQ